MRGPVTGARRVVPLTLENLDDVAGPCRGCLAWQHEDPAVPVPPPLLGPGDPTDPVRDQDLRSWVAATLLSRPSAGRVAYVGPTPVGHAIAAPPHLLPGANRFASGRASADAILVAAFRVRADVRDSGIARMLVTALARDATEQGMRAVEAYGSRSADAGRGCLLPTDFLVRCGFSEVARHPVTPRLRLDIRGVTTWRAEVESAIERLVNLAGAPSPAY